MLRAPFLSIFFLTRMMSNVAAEISSKINPTEHEKIVGPVIINCALKFI